MSSYQIKVYKIVNDETDEIYVRSTKEALSKRFCNHTCQYNKYNAGKLKSYCSSYDLFDKYGVENCSIVLIENYQVNNREEQLKHERFHYDELRPFIVNKNKPFATVEEHKQRDKVYGKIYKDDHKDEIHMKDKAYRELHKEERKPKMKVWNDSNKDIKREWYDKHKADIQAKDAVPIICECGRTYRHSNKSRHTKSATHLAYTTQTH